MHCFIELPEGYVLNVDNISHIARHPSGAIISLKSMNQTGYGTGSWQPGGLGNYTQNLTTEHSYVTTNLTPREILALINKEVALVHAMETAANATLPSVQRPA